MHGTKHKKGVVDNSDNLGQEDDITYLNDEPYKYLGYHQNTRKVKSNF